MFGLTDPSHRVAILNEEAAAELFGRQTVGIVLLDSEGQPIEVIGVVKRKSNHEPQKQSPTIYYGYIPRQTLRARSGTHRFRAPVQPLGAALELNANVVSASFFNALDLPLIAGRTFPDHRIPALGRVAVINQEAADLYFNGKPLDAAVISDDGVRTEVIGVVKSQVFGTFEQHAEPTIYFPMEQDCLMRMTLILKDSTPSNAVLSDLRSRIENVPGGSTTPILINTLDKQLAQSGLATLRIATVIGGASAATALLLSILGLLSAQSDAERQRQRDRALRIALGAQRWRIVSMVMTNAGWLALVGTVVGTSLSFALLRFLIADITAVPSPPLRAWLVAPLLPAAAVILASVLPARRASVISPMTIMRDI